MFDFEKLEAYQHLKTVTVDVLRYVAAGNIEDAYLADQLKRASMSALLNLSEGTGRRSPADKKRFYTIARSSVFEIIAILDVLKEMGVVDMDTYRDLYEDYTKASKMLLGMYRSFDAKV